MNQQAHPATASGATPDECVASWPQLQSGIHYSHLVDYHSYNAFGTYSLSPEEWDNREMIYNFKNNSELTDPISHKQAMDKAIELLTALLKATFGEQLPKLTLTCIPASTAEKTAARFREFSEIVTAATGMENGYSHISVVADQERLEDSHLPQYAIDADYYSGRQVLLFDDIMATGGSVSKFAARMEEAGAHVVAAVVLGKTVSRPKDE